MPASPHNLTQRPLDPRLSTIIKLVVMAVGGQGGGVLTNWIEDLARANGYDCQATSVAGVSQRTGATIYYVEMAPKAERTPVFSLMPAAGDVDILIAAEMMEAGRAIIRGFVTPDRTTLIASTHRALAVSEKTVPGDGIAKARGGGGGGGNRGAAVRACRLRGDRAGRGDGHLGVAVRRARWQRGVAVPAGGVRGGDPWWRQRG